MSLRSSSQQPVETRQRASEDERGQDTMRARWWWQSGPMTSCCGGYVTIRTGIYLISLYYLFSAVFLFNMARFVSTFSVIYQEMREEYNRHCIGTIVTDNFNCDEVLRTIEKGETSLMYLRAGLPVAQIMGAFLLLQSLVGFAAAYTKKLPLARLNVVLAFVRLACVLSELVSAIAPLGAGTVLGVIIYAYFTKVSWSFCKRLQPTDSGRQGPVAGTGLGLDEELLSHGNSGVRGNIDYVEMAEVHA